MDIKILIVLICIGIWTGLSFLKKMDRIRHNVTVLFAIRLAKIAVLITIAALLISLIPGADKSWRTIITGSGIAAAILGLAAQSTLSNVFAGMAISSINRPFDIGDRVQIGDIEPGFVKNITLRHVELMTYMGQLIIIPNNTVQNSVIVNYTKVDGNAYPIEITVGYGSDIDRAVEIFEDVVNNHPKHYQTPCKVLLKEAGDYGIKLKGTVETKDYLDTTVVCSECLEEIIKRYKAEGISIPYPTMEVIKSKGKG